MNENQIKMIIDSFEAGIINYTEYIQQMTNAGLTTLEERDEAWQKYASGED